MYKILTLNSLNGKIITSDRADKNILAKFRNKLDNICNKHGIPKFSELIDYTHFSLDYGVIPFPEGMSLDDEVMAERGKWLDADKAYYQLNALYNILQHQPVRFGFLKNQYTQVLLELSECASFTKIAKDNGYKVNLSETVSGEDISYYPSF